MWCSEVNEMCLSPHTITSLSWKSVKWRTVYTKCSFSLYSQFIVIFGYKIQIYLVCLTCLPLHSKGYSRLTLTFGQLSSFVHLVFILRSVGLHFKISGLFIKENPFLVNGSVDFNTWNFPISVRPKAGFPIFCFRSCFIYNIFLSFVFCLFTNAEMSSYLHMFKLLLLLKDFTHGDETRY